MIAFTDVYVTCCNCGRAYDRRGTTTWTHVCDPSSTVMESVYRRPEPEKPKPKPQRPRVGKYGPMWGFKK